MPALASSASVEVGAPSGFGGCLQEVAVYGSALSADQVQAQYVAGSSPPPGTAIDYSYSNGFLQARTGAAGTANYTWDNSSLALMVSDGSTDYLYGPSGAPVEQVDLASAKTEYYVSDRQGSTRALVGAGGAIDATFSYDAYGNLASSTGNATTPLLYDGQYLDATTGFYYLRARWYDAATASFMSVDPHVSDTGTAYAYAGDNPVNESDPSGMLPCGDGASYWNLVSTYPVYGREDPAVLVCGSRPTLGWRHLEKHIGDIGDWGTFSWMIAQTLKRPARIVPRASNNTLAFNAPIDWYAMGEPTASVQFRVVVTRNVRRISAHLTGRLIITAFASSIQYLQLDSNIVTNAEPACPGIVWLSA